MDIRQAEINFKRAKTRHENEQTKGQHNLSVKQTKRMYYAAENLRKAYRKLQDARQIEFRKNQDGSYSNIKG